MSQRGRKSAAELSVVKNQGISAVDRPNPPPDLSPEQKNVWVQIVNDLPADWFRPHNLALLSQYCRHVVSAGRVSQLIENAENTEPFDVDEYDKLLKMQEREGRAMSSLATRMRISQQATYDPKKYKGKAAKKPWQS